MARFCPVCGSENTGASPKSHKNYTERGRLDIDYNRCDDCRAAWDTWHYVREDVIEVKAVRLGNGNRADWGEMPDRICKLCQSADVVYVQHDGHWRTWENETLRYECQVCGQIWQEMARVTDGVRVAWRLYRTGHK